MSMKHKIVLPAGYTKNYWTGKDEWPAVTPTQERINECKKWCKENIGNNGWNYYGQYRKIPFEFRFKRSEDLLAFKLKFCLHHATSTSNT